MDYFPIFLKLTERSCVVVGGGAVAARKAKLLIRSGAKVTVVAPWLHPAFDEFGQAIIHRKKIFTATDVKDSFLVVSATDDVAINSEVAACARRNDLLVNVVDNPQLSNFVFPAIIDRSPVVAAVSTGGAAPVLSRLLRARLESLIPHKYGRLAEICRRYRKKVKAEIADADQRRHFWERVLEGQTAELMFAGREQASEAKLEELIDAESKRQKSVGEIYLVGAGPGDPDLLTFRALRLMQAADVVVYDRLVSAEILSLVRRDADMIYAGKERHKHSMRQEQINNLLTRLAKAGKRVVRLKGGDPFIFGRGGEELETAIAQGVTIQVVPGITAASGCAAYAGIPLTHRDHAQSCVFVTGHVKNGIVELNWKLLTAPDQTIVIFMGLVGLDYICKALIRHGSPSDLPAALIQQGTTENQRVLIGNLTSLPDIVKSSNVQAPTLVIIGNVVSLQKKLSWFQTERPQ